MWPNPQPVNCYISTLPPPACLPPPSVVLSSKAEPYPRYASIFLCAIPCPVPMPLRALFTMLHDSAISSLKILQASSHHQEKLFTCETHKTSALFPVSSLAVLRYLTDHSVWVSSCQAETPEAVVSTADNMFLFLCFFIFFLTVAPQILSYGHWQVCFSWSPSPWLACVLVMFCLHVCDPVLSLNCSNLFFYRGPQWNQDSHW